MLLVGAGETIELVARHLREHHVRKMVIANRTRERAQALAEEVGAEVIALSDIDERLKEADIIISSTASPLPIIGKGMVERALKARRNQPMLLVDIAVPRDVEPEVGKLANAYLYSTASTICKTSFSITWRSVRLPRCRRNRSSSRKPANLWPAARAERQRDHSRIPLSV